MNKGRSLTVAAVLGLAMASGGWLMGRSLRQEAPPVVDGRRLFQQVMETVERQFVDSLPADSIWKEATLGMVDELHDPHSVFLVADRLKRFREQTTGQYAGLGLRVDVRDGWITVIAPLPGSPSEAAGLQTGDRVVRIDALDTKGLTSEEALVKLRGNAGSRVVLTVERLGVEGRLTFTLTRQVIHVRAVQRVAMLPSQVGYLDVSVFSDSTADEVSSAVDSLRRMGMQSLVLDLRGNPGGLVEQGAAVSDLFLDPGQVIVTLRGRTPESNKTFTDKLPQRWPTLPVLVLVDRGSASAAEIVAGALQDHDRAVVVGATTYGKGSAQSVFDAGTAGALKLTTSLWFTPVGRSISIRRRSTDDVASRDGSPVPDDSLHSEADSMVRRRESFTTDKGRVVYGGGGITPDVIARDSAALEQGASLQAALGRAVPAFRDALTALALQLKSSGTLTTPAFTVTPAMRASLLAGVRTRGAIVADSAFELNADVVNRLIGYEVSRYVFGRDAEFTRRTADDPVMQRALTLLRGAPDRAALLVRASAEHPSKAG
ncbi:MAG TPA: S41 family peptidase, partial [Gemmatimonadaceae bacterium]|nr:S41 family peptidase [Gemmatimonadaceae bacterium]